MERQVILPIVDDIMEFFFHASLTGYAGGGHFVTEKSDSGIMEKVFRYKAHNHERGNNLFMYVDRYTSHGEFSRGDTTIYFEANPCSSQVDPGDPSKKYWIPVWAMSYHGWCKDDGEHCHKFLKQCLKSAYELKRFYGVNYGSLQNHLQ